MKAKNAFPQMKTNPIQAALKRFFIAVPLGVAVWLGAGLSVQADPPPSDALIHYDLDGVNGTIVTNTGSLGSAANGVLQGGSVVAGQFGNALSFSGSGSGIITANTVAIGNAFTFACWVSTTAGQNGVYQRIILNDYQQSGYLGTVNDGRYLTIVKGNNFFSATSRDTSGAWHHLAFTWDGTTEKFYYDGVINTTAVPSAQNTTFTGKFGFGCNLGAGENWVGKMDDAYVFGRALSATEVTNLYLNVSSAPATPTGVSATPVSSGVVSVGWTASVGATGYNVSVSNTVTTATQVIPNTAPPLSVTGLSNGTLYQFAVQATNSVGASNYSATVSATPALGSAKNVLTFVFPSLPSATISGTNISEVVQIGTIVTALAPTYTVSAFATGSPVSGTVRDFTTPQTYTVTAENGSAQAYRVTVTQANLFNDGTWINQNTGNLWDTAANWSGGAVANGSGFTANFSSFDLAADITVRLNSSHTLGGLTFGDHLTGSAGGWLLDDNASAGANILTLAGATPTITVGPLASSKTAAISTVIAGAAGLTKAGSGSLTLNGALMNTLTGGLTLNGGTTFLDFVTLGSTANLVNSGNALALGGGILNIKGKGAAFTAAQTLGNVTINAGGGQILGNNNGGTSTTITLGSLTATAAGGSLLVGTAAGNTTGLTITTTSNTNNPGGIYGGRTVWFNGTANTGYDWATTASVGSPYSISGLAAGGYTALPTSGGSSSVNYKMTGATALAGSFSVNTLKLEAPSGDLALGANTLTVSGGGLLLTGSSGRNITGTAGATTLTAGNGSGAYDLIVQNFANADLNIGAVIGNNGANSVSLTKNGPGKLIISGINTYTGATYLNAGTLSPSAPLFNTLGTSTSLTIQSGATLEVNRSTFGAGVTLTLNGGTISGGNGFGDNFNGPIVLAASSTFDTASTGQWNVTGAISGPGGLIKNNGGNAGPLNGPVTLSGVNTYTGPTIINGNGGMLLFTKPVSLYNAVETSWTPANITVGGSGASLALKVGGATDFTGTQAGTLIGNLLTVNNNGLRAGATVVLDTQNATADTTVAANITDSTGPGGGLVRLTKNGGNAMIFSGANTYSGSTLINGGTLKAGVAWNSATQSGAFGRNSAVTANAGVAITGFDTQIGSLTGNGSATLGANTLTIGGDNTTPAAYNGIMSGAGGSLTKIGTGVLTLGGPNTYTGITTISNGIINLAAAEVVGTSGPLGASVANNPGFIVMAGGQLQHTGANQNDYSGRFSTAAGQIYNVDTASQNVTWATALTSASGILIKTGGGTLTLSGANTYIGATTVNGGMLKANVASVPGVSGAFGLNSAVTLANTAGVILDLNGNSAAIGSLTGGGATGGVVSNAAVALTIGGDNTSPAAFTGVITGNGGSLVKVGTGTLTLNNTDTYTGKTTVSAGTLALGASGALPNTSGIDLAQGATFDASLVTSPYTFGTTTTLSASGTNLTVGSALLVGPASINLAGRPMLLNFKPTSAFGDRIHPSLVVSNVNMDTTGVVITLTNSGVAMNVGTFALVTNVVGTFTGTPSLANGTVYGNGLVAGRNASIGLSADSKAVLLTVSASSVPVTVTLVRNVATVTTNTYGDTLLFDVTVTTATNGTVTLYDGGPSGTVIGSGSLTGGLNTVTITAYLNGLTAGTHANIVAVYGGDAGHFPSNSAALTPAQFVGPKTISVTGAVGNNRLFDGTAAATLTGTLVGVVAGDTATEVNLIGTGTFDNGGAIGTGLTITSTSTLGGTKASSYTLTQPIGAIADVLSTAIWTSLSSGNWSTAANWTNNAIGNGAGVTADFSTLNITAGVTVQLDSPRTIGGMTFGDTVAGQSWTLGNNSQPLNVLTMAGTNSPTITATAPVTIIAGLNLATNVTVANTAGVTINGGISGIGGLVKTNAGTLSFATTSINTYTGGTMINAGTVYCGLQNPSPLGGAGSVNVTVQSGAGLAMDRNQITGSLTLNGGAVYTGNGWGDDSWTGPVALTATSTIDVGSTDGALAVNGVVSGAGGLIKLGPSLRAVALSGANTFTGDITISAGVLRIAGSGYLGGGNYAGNISIANNPANGQPKFIYGSSAVQTLSGSISGSGPVQQTAGKLTLSGVNTYTGITTVNTGGSLELATPASLYNAVEANWTPANLTVNSGCTLLVDVGGDSGFTSDQVGTLLANLLAVNNNGLRGDSTFGFGGTNTGSVSAPITDSVGTGGGVIKILKSGTSTVTLAGASTYTGTTTINAGKLKAGVVSVAGVSSAFGFNTAVTLANVATASLDITGFNTEIGSLTGGGALGGNVILGAATLTVGGDGTTPAAFAGNISGVGGGLTKVGGGMLELSGTNTATGATMVEGGVLICDTSISLGAGALFITNGAVLNLNYADDRTVASLMIEGVAQPVGIYGSSSSAATTVDDTHFTGTGTVTVSGAAPTPTLTGITGPVAGQFTFTGTSSGAGNIVTLMTTNLNPTIIWTPIQTNPVSAGAFSITVTNGLNAQAYYRLMGQ